LFTEKEFENVSAEAKDLCEQFLRIKDKPKKRIKLKDAINHPFFQDKMGNINSLDSLHNLDIQELSNNLKKYKDLSPLSKAIRICMVKVYIMPDSNIEQLKQLFLEVDLNHNGMLDYSEFSEALKHMDVD